MMKENSRVAEAPAQIVLCEGKHCGMGDSWGDAIDVGSWPGTVSSMEVIRDTVGMGNPAKTKWRRKENATVANMSGEIIFN